MIEVSACLLSRWTFLAFLSTLCGVFLFGIGVNRRLDEVKERGTEALASVVSKQNTWGIRRGYIDRAYLVRFRYSTIAGVQHDGSVEVSGVSGSLIHIGDQFRILYDAETPQLVVTPWPSGGGQGTLRTRLGALLCGGLWCAVYFWMKCPKNAEQRS
jgi:hypothetical protein